MSMHWTVYQLPSGHSASTQCFALDDAHLEEVMAKRKMGERAGPGPTFGGGRPLFASELVERNYLAAANHALVWASMIAVRAGVSDAWDLLNDEGLVHSLAHLMHSREEGYRDSEERQIALARRIEAFERFVPGLHPCWGGDDRPLVSPPPPPRMVFDARIYFDGQEVGKVTDVQVPSLQPVTITNTVYRGPTSDSLVALELAVAALRDRPARALARMMPAARDPS